PGRPRSRLVALHGAPSSPPDPADPRVGETSVGDPAPDPPPRSRPSADRGVFATSGAGRLVQRWVPGPLRDARWEPGRPGALMLSLVAALAAVVAAIGVWRGGPGAPPPPAPPPLPPPPARRPPGPAPRPPAACVGRRAPPA